jgi:hypothetical protein
MFHDFVTYFSTQLNNAQLATADSIAKIIARNIESAWRNSTPEQIQKSTEYLTSKVGQSMLYFMKVEAPTGDINNHVMDIISVWSDEFDQLDLELIDYVYSPLGDNHFPRFVHRTHLLT